MRSIAKLIWLVAVPVLSAIAAAAVMSGDHPEPRNSPPPARQFEFWLGEWELTWPGEQSGLPAGQIGRGTNSIKAILDSCVIEENFVDLAPNSLRGKSFSVYNKRLGKWQQTWVDNQSSYLDFVGEFKDGKMILKEMSRNQWLYMIYTNAAKKRPPKYAESTESRRIVFNL